MNVVRFILTGSAYPNTLFTLHVSLFTFSHLHRSEKSIIFVGAVVNNN